MRYGVSFVGPASDWYSASVPVIIYAISYNIGPYHNTQLYKEAQLTHCPMGDAAVIILKLANFKFMSKIDILSISCAIALR